MSETTCPAAQLRRILQAFQIKGRCIFFSGAAFFLHKSLCESKIQGSIHNLLVFVAGDAAVQFRKLRILFIGGILAHEADIKAVLWQLLCDPVHQPDGVILTAGKNQMPDDDSAVHDRGCFSGYLFEVRVPGLADHLRNCFRGSLEIERSLGVARRQFRAFVFEIRKPDIHIILQRLDRFRPFITAAVVDNRNAQPVFDKIQCRDDPGQKMGGGYQAYVVGTLILKAQKDIGQLTCSQCFAV